MCKNKNVHAFFTLHCNVLKNVGLCCQEKVFHNTRTREAPVPMVTGFQFDWSTGLFNRPTPILTDQLTSSSSVAQWTEKGGQGQFSDAESILSERYVHYVGPSEI